MNTAPLFHEVLGTGLHLGVVVSVPTATMLLLGQSRTINLLAILLENDDGQVRDDARLGVRLQR